MNQLDGQLVRYIIMPFLALALIQSGCERKPERRFLTPARFTDAYIAKLRSADASISVEKTGELQLRVRMNQPGGHNVFLDNAYREYGVAPADLDDVLDRYVHAFLESVRMPQDDAIDITRVVPVIKDVDYPVEIRKALIESGQDDDKLDFFYETLNERLLILYALDTEHNIRYLGREDISTLGLEPEDLRSRAVKNLSVLLPEIRKYGDAGTFIVSAGGTYESSLLLFDSIWSTDTFNVDGEIVVTIPSRDILVVTGSRDADGLKQLRSIAAETVQESSYYITPELFVRRDGKWLPFKE